MRRFEFVEGTSAKFWQAESSGTTFIVEFGRLGTKGQRKEKDFPNEDAAKKELEKKNVGETCDGVNSACPDDAKIPQGTECKAASAECELPAVCNE